MPARFVTTSLVTKRAVATKRAAAGLSQTVLLTLFSRALSRVSVWHHGQDTGTSQFCVHISCINYFCQCLFFKSGQSVWNSFIFLTFHWEQHNKTGNKLIIFEIAKTNNVMMSNVLSNILGWPGGNSSKQVRLIPMHASRHDSVRLM